MADSALMEEPYAAPTPALRWVDVGAGRLALTHRPKLRGMPQFRAEGCVRLVTLLSAREHAERIGELAQEAGLEWTWLPLNNGRPPAGSVAWSRVGQALILLAARLDVGESIALHCSAGIHHTGMIAYALLGVRGYAPEQALDAIAQMRPVTRAGLRSDHLQFGDAIAEWLRTS